MNLVNTLDAKRKCTVCQRIIYAGSKALYCLGCKISVKLQRRKERVRELKRQKGAEMPENVAQNGV